MAPVLALRVPALRVLDVGLLALGIGSAMVGPAEEGWEGLAEIGGCERPAEEVCESWAKIDCEGSTKEAFRKSASLFALKSIPRRTFFIPGAG